MLLRLLQRKCNLHNAARATWGGGVGVVCWLMSPQLVAQFELIYVPHEGHLAGHVSLELDRGNINGYIDAVN